MGRERIIHLHSAEETFEWGRLFAASLQPNTILALSGDLGAGKTTLVQGIAQGLMISEAIQSPTYTYLNIYQGLLPLFHFDLYRLPTPSDFLGLGFDEYFEAGGVCAIEWPEKMGPLLPPTTRSLQISLTTTGRKLILSQS